VPRDADGWYYEGRWLVFHPHSYGIATLLRLAVKLPGGGKLMLHHFRPHAEEEFHDHPWAFATRVLWGSYVDESLAPDGSVVRDVLRRGDTRRRRAEHAHRTSCTGHVWTLVLAQPKSRTWCKGDPRRWVCGGRVTDFDATRGMVRVDAS
jgi:hypothetical protein